MAKPRTARDYGDDVTAASRVGLAEIMTVLGSYRDALVLIGGWVPSIILETFGEPGQEAFDANVAFAAAVTDAKFIHVGSIDIDLVVDPSIIDEERYATIVELLLDHGYEPVADSRYQFERMIRSPRSCASLPHPCRFSDAKAPSRAWSQASPSRSSAGSPRTNPGGCPGRPHSLVLVRAGRKSPRRRPSSSPPESERPCRQPGAERPRDGRSLRREGRVRHLCTLRPSPGRPRLRGRGAPPVSPRGSRPAGIGGDR